MLLGIQVCAILHADNRDREIARLMEAMQFLEMESRFILTLNQNDEIVKNGKRITIMEVSGFLTLL